MTAADNRIVVKTVETKADLKAFIALPFRLYQDDPHWVPPLYIERQDHLSPKSNPFFQHADVKLMTAWRGDVCVGRISVQVCEMHQERYQEQCGQFGLIEAEDDPAIFAALFSAAEAALREKGMKRVRGPFSLSINEEAGLLVEGFETSPFFMMGHARPYYDERIKACGYDKAKDMFAYVYDPRDGMSRAMMAMVKKAARSGDLVIRSLSKKNLARDLEIIIQLFNDAWSENWDFVPMTAAEIKRLGQNLKTLVPEPYISIVDFQGKPAAMAVSLPNLNEAIKDLGGKLLPFGWAKLLWRLKVQGKLGSQLSSR